MKSYSKVGPAKLEITADTNVLVRVLIQDNLTQARVAEDILTKADLVALPLMALCELCWVLSRGYKETPESIARAIRTLTAASNAVFDPAAVAAGLDLLDAGGDFADGVAAHEGRRLGGDEFVSFDETAVNLLVAQGKRARLLS